MEETAGALTTQAAFLAGMVTLAILGALLYYGAGAFNAYIDARARAVILDTLQGYPVPKNVEPPSRENT